MQTKLDKAFKIIVDISNRKVTIPQAISWYVTDENIAHLNCQIIDEVEDSIIDIQSYKLSMRVLTPSRILKEVNYTLSDSTNNIFTLTLPDELITEKGRHQCELSIEYLGDKLTSEPFNYNIIQSIANQLDSTISKDSHYPLVLELEDKLKEWNNILDEQVSKVIILNNDVTNAEKTRQANEAQRIEAENERQEGYIEFKNEVSEELAYNEKFLDDIFININKYKERIVNNDLTEVLQELVNEHSKIYIPSGEYTLSNLTIPSDTEIVCSSEALITLNGSISNKVDIIKNWSIQSSNPVSKGDTIITLSDTSLISNVSVGDIVQLYNNGYMPEDEWLEESNKEDAQFKYRQFAFVKAVTGNSIEIDSQLEFSSDTIQISYHNRSEDIKISGGKWITTTSKCINISNCTRLVLSDMTIQNNAVTIPLFLEYIQDSEIRNLKVTSVSNTAIWLARSSNNVKISNNIFKMGDEFAGDATILAFDDCKYIDVFNNRLELNHYNAPNQNKVLIGISIHTLSSMCNVHDNYVKGYTFGISSHFGAKHNTFISNRVELCGAGIFIHKASYTKICLNTIIKCNNSKLTYPANVGGISFAGQYASYKIDITDNIIIESSYGVNTGSDLNDSKIIGNTFIRNTNGISTGNNGRTYHRIIISNNTFTTTPEITESTTTYGINIYGRELKYANICNNTFENLTYAIRYYNHCSFTNIYQNICSNCGTFCHIRYDSHANLLFDNMIQKTLTGFSLQEPAGGNDYHDNIFLEVDTPYGFTDDYNMSKQYEDIPVGFKCHSIDPTSDYIYYEKISEGKTLDCWRKIKKYI